MTTLKDSSTVVGEPSLGETTPILDDMGDVFTMSLHNPRNLKKRSHLVQ